MASENHSSQTLHARLCAAFVGKKLRDMPVPSVVLDASKIKQNCKLMLDAVAALKLSFRAHVKTHKTLEVARLQVGENCKDVRFIVSTVLEAESLIPLLKDYQSKGASINVLYGIPLGPSNVSRLAAVAKQLGTGSITTLIDHPAQLAGLGQFKQDAGFPISVLIKTDSGYHRAGIPPDSETMAILIQAVVSAESQGNLHFAGFYSHNSLSYKGDHPDEAMSMLNHEIETCQQAASRLPPNYVSERRSPLIVSVGATPTSISIQNIQNASPFAQGPMSQTDAASILTRTLSSVAASSEYDIEVHAGVYPIFDLQQIAASSRSFPSPLSAHNAQALTVLAEVLSVYPNRTQSPEALIGAGTLALAHEPCKSYPGWGVVTSWGFDQKQYSEEDSADAEKRLTVKRISQEHGIIGWGDEQKTDVLPEHIAVGSKVRVWINHACITSAGFGWYLVVDESKGGEPVVEDVWIRFPGW